MVRNICHPSNTNAVRFRYVFLKERNMLLTMEEAYRCRAKQFPCPERLDRIKESMENLENIVHERNDAYLKLETGMGASPPERTITSFLGFTYNKQATEHYEPSEVSGEKEYEVPYLDDDAYLMQKLWNEKMHMKKEIAAHDAYMNAMWHEDRMKHGRNLRRTFNRPDHMPQAVVDAVATAKSN
jgi:large subunit ribosomal protein L47